MTLASTSERPLICDEARGMRGLPPAAPSEPLRLVGRLNKPAFLSLLAPWTREGTDDLLGRSEPGAGMAFSL
jgi:hypothetical protein